MNQNQIENEYLSDLHAYEQFQTLNYSSKLTDESVRVGAPSYSAKNRVATDSSIYFEVR